MATYFHGAPEIQSDGLQTLYLMNPGYFGQSDAAAQTWSESLNPMILSHNPQPNHHHQHLVGIPNSEHPTSIHTSHEVSAVQASPHRLHYNLWNPTPSSNSIDVSPANSREVKDLGPGPDGITGLQSVLMGSKYLKAAQRLLDEVVSFGNESKRADSKIPTKGSRESEGVGEPDTSAKQGANLTAAERQELQMKKAKLVNMMDEVEQRYRHYRNQMQLLISSFESLAGFKSARTYTSLALQTISKQFRCLRDAISAQILLTSRRLGEEDHPVGGTKSASSRLGIVDPHNARQQQTLQQLGMIQHNAWRPQRGLPERAVSVLRAWLFEHFLHPYPKDSDKHMLAMQTGLTRSQVSNWFINARVRLWKPMVEEMYLKEFKDEEENDASTSNANDDSASKSSTHRERSPTSAEQTDSLKTNQGTPNDSKFYPITNNSENHEAIIQPSPKRSRIDQSVSVETKHEDDASSRKLLMKLMDGRSGGDGGYPSIAGAPKQVAGFGVYTIGEIARFDHEQFATRLPGNSVSLTLGLQHSENLPLSETQQSYIYW